MNLDHLRYFQAIARWEHYGRAAEELHVSQPNLTYAISQLERELGVPLFERNGCNVRLTRYGKSFLHAVTQSLQALGAGGDLVLLGGIRKLASQLAPVLMRQFLEQPGNENVRFELHTESGFSGDLLKAVEEEQLDMAFVSHPADPTVFECVSFQQSPFVLVTPRDHPLAQKGSVTLRETLPYPYVFFSRDASRTAYLCRKRLAVRPLAAERFFRFCIGALQALPQ
ncbi:MAG: LysR family transcriptional regulator [Aristaeellaceae bacterium]